MRAAHRRVAGQGLPAAAWGILILAFALRLVLLDADPHYYAWTGHFTDEGRWIESARSLALDGELDTYPKNLHLMLAPLYQLLNAPVLMILGVGIDTTRLVTSLFGSAILLLAAWWLGKRVCREALLVGIALLALQTDLLMLSRMAIPEIPAMFAEAVIALLLIRGAVDRRMNIWAGVAVLVGIGLKSTLILVACALVLLPLLLPGGRQGSFEPKRSIGRRLADAALYVSTFAGPLLLVAAFALWRGLAPSGDWYLPDLSRAGGPWALLNVPFGSMLSSTLAPWAAGAWLAVLSVWGGGREGATAEERRRVVGISLWLLATLLPAVFSEYFPHRYQVHALVPLAFLVAVGVDVYLRRGAGVIDARLAGPFGSARVGSAALLALPFGVLLAPAAMPIVASLGNDPERLRAKLVAIAATTALAAAVVVWLGARRPLAAIAVRLTVMAALIWIWLGMTSYEGTFWREGGGSMPTATWGALVAIAVGLTAIGLALEFLLPAFRDLVAQRGVGLAVTAWLVAALVAVSPNYLTPYFTARDVSRDLGVLLADARSVVSHKAETLFNENDIRYRSEYRIDPVREPAEYFVTLKGDQLFWMFQEMLAKDYELVKSYRLYISPECEANYRARRGSAEAVRTVTVHRRKAGGLPFAGARHPSPSGDAGRVATLTAPHGRRTAASTLAERTGTRSGSSPDGG